MKKIKEVKYNNLRRLFYIYDKQHPITNKEFAKILHERNDVIGKHLSGQYEIPDEKITKWCDIVQLPPSFFYDEHPTAHWPPQKKSYRYMPLEDRLALAAEDYREYNRGTRKLAKIIEYLKLVCDELLRVVPKEALDRSPILRHFVDTFKMGE